MTELYDDAFTIEKSPWGTWSSYSLDGVKLVTSLDKELCLEATRFYLKGKQEGFQADVLCYDGTVGGKL